MKRVLSLAGLLLVMGLPFSAIAAPAPVYDGDILRRVEGLQVGDSSYTVLFDQGTCNDAFAGCDSGTFDFANIAAASQATNALGGALVAAEVNLEGLFGGGSSSSCGMVGNGFGCTFLTPYGFAEGLVQALALYVVSEACFGGCPDPFQNYFVLYNSFAGSFSRDDPRVIRWIMENPSAQVPEPGTLAVILAGLAAVGFMRRRTLSAT